MNSQMIAELEAAAGILMASPTNVTIEQRQAAEQVFLNFRKSKLPYTVCRQILDSSDVHYVLFEAAEVLKTALIREWSFLQESDRSSLRKYVFEYLSTRDVPSYVREKLLQVLAIMIKRRSIDDGGKDRAKLFGDLKTMIVNGKHQMKILACSLLNNLMQEYASTIKSTDVGLPWEVHFKAKKQFETTDMKEILKFCVQLISDFVSTDGPYNETVTELISNFLCITESILSWGFISPMLPKRLIGIYESMYESEQAPSLRLHRDWSDIMFEPQFLPLMFQLYWKVRYNEDLAQHALNCLVQLASLNGDIMYDQDVKVQYLTNYMENFLKMVSSITIKGKEALTISNLVRKLQLFFAAELQRLPKEMIDSYSDEITTLTCNFCVAAASEEANPDSDTYFSDAFDNLLEAWTSIVPEYAAFSETNLPQCATTIFNCYLQSHLAPPDGTRPSGNNHAEEIEDNEDNDRIKYRDQLQTIGMFGRLIPSHALSVLYKLLEMYTDKLKVYLTAMQSKAMNMDEASALENLFEDIHWTILIAGYVICMDHEGETPTIPCEMMRYSLDMCNGNEPAVLNASLHTIAAVPDLSSNPPDLEQCDHIVRVVCDVLKLCHIEKTAAEAKLGHFMSPEVSCSLMWFLNRWCLSYLLPIEDYYQMISPIIVGTMGADSESAGFLIDVVLHKIESNIIHFHSEPVLLRDTVELFNELTASKRRAMHVIDTQALKDLLAMQQKIGADVFAPDIRCQLYKAFTMAGKAVNTNNIVNTYLQEVIAPVEMRFNKLLNQENFNRIFHEESVQKELVDILECYMGIAMGAQMSTVEYIFQSIAPTIFRLPDLIVLYSNYDVIVQTILKLYGQFAKNTLCYLSRLDSKRLYDGSLAAIQAYSKCNANRLTGESFAEENTFVELGLIIELLTYILSKDCIDLCVHNSFIDEEITITASDVALFGLNFIMPLMNLDLLKYPKLCAQYYRLLVLINDIYPEKICSLPQELLSKLLASIEVGLTQFSSEIAQAALDFIQGIATYLYRHPIENKQMYVCLKPFLKLLMDLTLSRQINSDVITFASTAIYSLICCYPEEYESLVNQLVSAQTDALVANRLAAAFQNLMTNVQTNCERQPKLKFRDNFERFTANVHGFLLVK